MSQPTVLPLLASPIVVSAKDSLVNNSTRCQAAGSLAVGGKIVREVVDLTAVYTGCQPLRFTLDGTITIQGTADQLSGRLNWHGFLTITGPSAGQCWVDVLLEYTPSTKNVTGSVCGADARGLSDAAKRTGLTS